MKENKKARSGAATPKQANETRAPRQDTHISYHNNSIISLQNQHFIESLLSVGKENAISTTELMQLSGIKSARQLQKQISSERDSGAFILSSTTGGYYLPDSGEKGRQEIKEYVKTLRARALNTLKVLKGVKATLDICEGQGTLEEYME